MPEMWEGPLFLAWFLPMVLGSFGLGIHWARHRTPASTGPAEAALLGWLALLLSLTLWQSQRNFWDRTTLVHQEADEIAKVYRILDTIPQANRTQMRLILISYLEAKLHRQERQTSEEEIQGLQNQLYVLAGELSQKKVINESQAIAMEAAVSHMMSAHYRSSYALSERLAGIVTWTLVLQCLAVGFLLGSSSSPERRMPILLVFSILASSTLALALDLDGSTGGWIRVDVSNLRDLVNALHSQEHL